MPGAGWNAVPRSAQNAQHVGYLGATDSVGVPLAVSQLRQPGPREIESNAFRRVRLPDESDTIPASRLHRQPRCETASGSDTLVPVSYSVLPSLRAPRPASAAPATTQSATTLPAKEFKTKDGKILPSMEALSKLTGDPKAGSAVFRNEKGANCIKCHQIGDDGNMIGPPLTVVGGKLSKPQLYEAILYPSAAIEMGYETYVVKTKSGEVYSGLKTEDTPNHITIKDTDGKYHDIDRADIDRLVKQAISLMPEGLSEAMTQQDLVNLVEYLESLKP